MCVGGGGRGCTVCEEEVYVAGSQFRQGFFIYCKILMVWTTGVRINSEILNDCLNSH